MSIGLYLHIPYCLAKCNYCDFYSQGGSGSVPNAYCNALLREWAAQKQAVKTVYFGGGTPSLLQPQQVACLLDAICPPQTAEITLEANPETLTLQTLQGYRAAGVNRLSIGVQSASDEQLRRLGRPHTAQQAGRALAMAQQAGFGNISGDIMLALPHYTNAEFDQTLQLLQQGGATHISAYLLKIEPNTPFGKRPPHALPDPDTAADFYLYAVAQLAAAGYQQYEISNFAKAGYEGQHNLIYWNCGSYLGLGTAAHSCIGRKRFYYPSDTAAFVAGCAPIPDGEQTAEDFILLQLRLCSGLDLEQLKAEYHLEFSQKQLQFVAQCVAAGYANFDGNRLRLTPQGMLVQNSILVQLLG